MDLLTILILAAKISIFLTVLSLGMRASLSDITHLFRRPAQLIRGLTSMYLFMPAFAMAVVLLFNLDPVIETVLIALSISPVPPIFPKKGFKSGGEANFTFGLLAAFTLLSIIVVPLYFRFFESVVVRETHFSQAGLIKTLLTFVVLPMVIGMVLRYLAPAFSERFSKIIEKIGTILLLISVLPILIKMLPAMWSLVGNFTILAFVLFTVVGASIGYFLGGPDPKERSVLALATATRHPGIAIALTIPNVDESLKGLVIAAVLLYLIVSAIVIAPFLKWLSADKESDKVVEAKQG